MVSGDVSSTNRGARVSIKDSNDQIWGCVDCKDCILVAHAEQIVGREPRERVTNPLRRNRASRVQRTRLALFFAPVATAPQAQLRRIFCSQIRTQPAHVSSI